MLGHVAAEEVRAGMAPAGAGWGLNLVRSEVCRLHGAQPSANSMTSAVIGVNGGAERNGGIGVWAAEMLRGPNAKADGPEATEPNLVELPRPAP